MNVPAYAIGLPEEWVAEIKKRSEVRYIAMSDVDPLTYASEGRSYLESQQTPGRYLQPNIVLWYGYYPDAKYTRTALAISNTPTFPDIRRTLPLDDKMLAVVMTQAVDSEQVNRGYHMPPITYMSNSMFPAPNWGPNTVIKWGNSHCGENKQLLVNGNDPLEGTSMAGSCILSEPFVQGESHRILVVGAHMSQLTYESEDWRKNVGSTITRLRTVDPDLAVRTRRLLERLGLLIAGVDYVLGEKGATLLEVNAYPSLDEDDEAREHFIKMAVQAVRKAQHVESED